MYETIDESYNSIEKLFLKEKSQYKTNCLQILFCFKNELTFGR